MQTCIQCKIEKDLNEFEIQKHKYYRQLCKTCKNKATMKHRIKSKYGLTPEDYQRMLEEQEYACAICGKAETGLSSHAKVIKKLAMDHNHVTGQIRRLLCAKCNTAIGLLNDNPYLAESVAAYLRSF